jgi:hypothetical protein
MPRLILLLGGLLVLLAACGGKNEPERRERDLPRDEMTSYTIDFSAETQFETGDFGEKGALSIENGEYLIYTGNIDGPTYLWGSTQVGDADSLYPALKNLVVEVAASPRAGTQDNWYGVMCRVNEQGEGYAFLIGADGFWTIARATGTHLDLLQEWRESDVIRAGQARNTLRAYCVEHYLALYVNDEFLGDFTVTEREDQLDRVGAVGLIAGGAENETTVVAFDDLQVASVQVGNTPNTPAPPTETPFVLETLPPLEIPPLGEDSGQGRSLAPTATP